MSPPDCKEHESSNGPSRRKACPAETHLPRPVFRYNLAQRHKLFSQVLQGLSGHCIEPNVFVDRLHGQAHLLVVLMELSPHVINGLIGGEKIHRAAMVVK